MTLLKGGSAAFAVLIVCSQAFASVPDTERDEIASQIGKLLAGKSTAEREQILARVKEQFGKTIPEASKPARVAMATMPAIAPTPKRPSASPTKTPAASTVFGNCGGLTAVLRRNWTDIDIASCPQSVKDATGALLSYSYDKTSKNTSWTVNGTAAVIYTVPESILSMGIYGTLNQVRNSSVAEAEQSNINSNAYGGFLEFVDTNNTYPYIANYFQLRGGGADDNIKKTSNANITAVWIPVYSSDYFHIHDPFNPIDGWPGRIRFDPELWVQYAAVTGRNRTLSFNDQSEALRVGPQVALRFYPGTSELLAHFRASVIYHWGYEVYSQRPITNLQANITYNLDTDGHLGLSLNYQRGQDEDTGVFSNVYLVSLTGKL
jgi:hypothetical protein